MKGQAASRSVYFKGFSRSRARAPLQKDWVGAVPSSGPSTSASWRTRTHHSPL